MEIKFCGYCGGSHRDLSQWPRQCSQCGQEHWRNPVPVSVVLVPVDAGVLTVRRSLPPGLGKLALPGGFIDWGESWQQAAVRELREETGITVDVDELSLLRIVTIAGVMLLFGQTRPRRWHDLKFALDPAEVSEVVKVEQPCELAFPTHSEVLAEFFRTQRATWGQQ